MGERSGREKRSGGKNDPDGKTIRMGKCSEWANDPNGKTVRTGRDAAVLRPTNSPRRDLFKIIICSYSIVSQCINRSLRGIITDAARRRPYPFGASTHPAHLPIRRIFPSGPLICTGRANDPNGRTIRTGRDAAVLRPTNSPRRDLFKIIICSYSIVLQCFNRSLRGIITDAARRRPYPFGPSTHSAHLPIPRIFP